MYEVIKEVINSKSYELVDMLNKIDKLWVEGKLTEEQREELITLARENANPEESKPETNTRLTALEVAVKDLTDRIAKLEGDTPPSEEVREYDASYQYKKGERCTYKGTVYEWLLDVPGVWSPEAYPQGWKKVS